MSPLRWAALLLAALFALSVPAAVAAAPTSSNHDTASALAATQVTNQINNIPIRGTTATGGTFRGQLDLKRFAVRNGELVAIGHLTGKVKDSLGTLIGTVDRKVALPVALSDPPECDILHLTLGPLDLDLLGLQVHLNRVVLTITAAPGPGNLLGNLLCAIVGLLDQTPPLNGVLRDLLNAVLGVLRL